MAKELKQLIVQEYTALFEGRDSLLFVDYQGAPVEEINELRQALREQNLQMTVVKNSLMTHALDQIGVEGVFNETVEGPCAVIWGEEEGAALSAAKFLKKWAKDKKSGAIKGGLLEGKLDDATAAEKYKDLPTKPELLSIISGQLLAPGAKLVSQLLAPGGLLASQVEKKAEGDESDLLPPAP